MKIKTAIIQFNITEGQIDTNMHKAEELLAAAAQEQVDLLILPEMWNSGFDFTHLSAFAQDFSGEAVALLPGALESLLSAAALPKRSMASFIIPAL